MRIYAVFGDNAVMIEYSYEHARYCTSTSVVHITPKHSAALPRQQPKQPTICGKLPR